MKNLLHIGCGYKTKKDILEYYNDEWNETRVDVNADVNPDVVGSMQDLSNIKNNFYDSIFSSHSIEHVFAHEVNQVLKGFLNVLNKSGFLVITCPDIKSISKLIMEDKVSEAAYESEAGPINPIDMLWGHSESIKNGNEFMAHKCGFTKKSLMHALTHAGFKSVAGIEAPKYFDLWAVAHKSKLEKGKFIELVKKILKDIGKVAI
mgnify:FL=1